MGADHPNLPAISTPASQASTAGVVAKSRKPAPKRITVSPRKSADAAPGTSSSSSSAELSAPLPLPTEQPAKPTPWPEPLPEPLSARLITPILSDDAETVEGMLSTESSPLAMTPRASRELLTLALSSAALRCFAILLPICERKAVGAPADEEKGVLGASEESGRAELPIPPILCEITANPKKGDAALGLLKTRPDLWTLFGDEEKQAAWAIAAEKARKAVAGSADWLRKIARQWAPDLISEKDWGLVAFFSAMEKDSETLRLASQHCDLNAVMVPVDDSPFCSTTAPFDRTGLLESTIGAGAAVTEVLLAAGCDPMAKNSEGQTALMLACAFGQIEEARLLLPVSDVNAESNNGFTALMFTASSKINNAHASEIVDMLLEAGANPRAQSTTGKTALMCALAYKKARPVSWEKVVERLLPLSDVLVIDAEGNGAFDIALTTDGGELFIDRLAGEMGVKEAEAAAFRLVRKSMPETAKRIAANQEAEELAASVRDVRVKTALRELAELRVWKAQREKDESMALKMDCESTVSQGAPAGIQSKKGVFDTAEGGQAALVAEKKIGRRL